MASSGPLERVPFGISILVNGPSGASFNAVLLIENIHIFMAGGLMFMRLGIRGANENRG